ncbi:MAG: T9SS type A sorting domain-containing protein [Bacteroidia bacterium]|nr:T9SS type A sorting domain-containing protein [Bacteroidia bacterium]
MKNGESRIESVEVWDVVGEKCLSALTPNPSPSGEGSASIDVSKLTPGIYFITVTDEKKNKVTRKVVKM